VTPAESVDRTRVLFGVVLDLDSGAPLTDVLVELLDPRGPVLGRTLSNAEGRFSFRLAPESDGAILQAKRIGYSDVRSETLRVAPGRAVEVRMAPRALDLRGLVVSVEARDLALDRNGFYDRRSRSGGQFLVREEIDAIVRLRTSDLLLHVPGIQAVSFSAEAANTTVRRIQLRGARRFSNDQRCLPGVYVDGALVRPPLIPLSRASNPLRQLERYPEVDDLGSARDIAAVEVYHTPGVTPARFQPPGPPCGVIVIWTRAGPGDR
jgi:hypothetical protein